MGNILYLFMLEVYFICFKKEKACLRGGKALMLSCSVGFCGTGVHLQPSFFAFEEGDLGGFKRVKFPKPREDGLPNNCVGGRRPRPHPRPRFYNWSVGVKSFEGTSRLPIQVYFS